MSEDNTEENLTIRKIYVLPRELADRITAFQKEKKLPSEVEAVRRLLDEALLHRDNPYTLLTRFKERLKSDAMPSSVAKDLLVGHPLITGLGFPSFEEVTFVMKGHGEFSINSEGATFRFVKARNAWESYDVFDDDIPF